MVNHDFDNILFATPIISYEYLYDIKKLNEIRFGFMSRPQLALMSFKSF